MKLLRASATGRSDQSADSRSPRRGSRAGGVESGHSKTKDRPVSTNERVLIVGVQAVIEGVMRRTPNAYAVAVRKADGTIVNIAARLPKWSDKYPLLKVPVLRGGAVLLQSMGLGIKALNYSANEAFADAQAAETKEVRVALTPAVIEGEGDFAGLTGAVPGLFPVPTQARPQDEMKKGGPAAARGSHIF